MAATTLTASTAVDPPRTVHEGNFSQYYHFKLNGNTITANDMVLLGYIPQNVTVLDGMVWGTISGTTAFRLGTSASTTAISTALSITAGGVNRISGPPRRFSLSADAEGNLKIPIFATFTAGTSTITGSLNLVLIMAADPLI